MTNKIRMRIGDFNTDIDQEAHNKYLKVVKKYPFVQQALENFCMSCYMFNPSPVVVGLFVDSGSSTCWTSVYEKNKHLVVSNDDIIEICRMVMDDKKEILGHKYAEAVKSINDWLGLEMGIK